MFCFVWFCIHFCTKTRTFNCKYKYFISHQYLCLTNTNKYAYTYISICICCLHLLYRFLLNCWTHFDSLFGNSIFLILLFFCFVFCYHIFGLFQSCLIYFGQLLCSWPCGFSHLLEQFSIAFCIGLKHNYEMNRLVFATFIQFSDSYKLILSYVNKYAYQSIYVYVV